MSTRPPYLSGQHEEQMEVNGGDAVFLDKNTITFTFISRFSPTWISVVCALRGLKNNSASNYLVRLGKLLIFVRNCESTHSHSC